MVDYNTVYNEWLTSPFVSDFTINQLKALSDEQKKEYFSSELEFGTAGLRGIIAPAASNTAIYPCPV